MLPPIVADNKLGSGQCNHHAIWVTTQLVYYFLFVPQGQVHSCNGFLPHTKMRHSPLVLLSTSNTCGKSQKCSSNRPEWVILWNIVELLNHSNKTPLIIIWIYCTVVMCILSYWWVDRFHFCTKMKGKTCFILMVTFVGL